MAPMGIRNGNYRLYQQSYDFGFGILSTKSAVKTAVSKAKAK
jgi:hypothetical protein